VAKGDSAQTHFLRGRTGKSTGGGRGGGGVERKNRAGVIALVVEGVGVRDHVGGKKKKGKPKRT